MAKTVEDAERELAALEKHRHAVADARSALNAAKFTGDPNIIEKALDALRAAEAARDASGITDRDIARAAQAVLDMRGEAHTETGILPPDHGINTVRASNLVAEAMRRHANGEVDRGTVIEAQEALQAAEAADNAAKLQHATERHAETTVTLQGE